MVPCRSIMTTLYTVESPSSLMEPSAQLPSSPLPRITNRGSTIHILMFPESSVSGIFSMLSCQRFFLFSFVIARCWIMCLRRTRKFRRLRSSEAPLFVNVSRRMGSKKLIVPCGAIEVLFPCQVGKTWIHVCLYFWNYKIFLWVNGKYRQLYKALHDWSWSFSPSSVTSTEALWGRESLPHRLRHCPAVWFDWVAGYAHLEGERGSPLATLLRCFFNSVSRALNDEVRPRFYTIQIPRPTAPNLVSTLRNFPPCDHISGQSTVQSAISPSRVYIHHDGVEICIELVVFKVCSGFWKSILEQEQAHPHDWVQWIWL